MKLKLSPGAQVSLIITGAVALLLFYFFVYRSEERQAREGERAIDENRNQVPNGQSSYLSNGEAAGIANAIEAALDGWGTDETALMREVAKLRNNADAHKLDKAFGIRDGESLGAWLASDGEISEMQEFLEEAKGITYKFQIYEV